MGHLEISTTVIEPTDQEKDTHVPENHPRECDRELPLLAFHRSLDVGRREVIRQVYVYFDVLEMWRIVDHTQYKAARHVFIS